MSTGATAKIQDESGNPLTVALTATLTDISALFDTDLGSVSFSTGAVSIGPYGDDALASLYGARKLRLRILNGTRDLIKPIEKDDVPGSFDFGSITIAQRDAKGWAVTLGLPAATPLPYFSQNNAVRPLVDSEEAWGYVATRLDTASTEVDIMQLELDVPHKDEPGIVLDFVSKLDKDTLRAVDSSDKVLEAQLKAVAAKPATVRILIDDARWTNYLAIFGEILLVLLTLPILLVLAIINIKTIAYSAGKAVDLLMPHPAGAVGDVKNYFKTAAPTASVLGFPRTLFNRIHAKLVMIDQNEAIVTGSPFTQPYYDASTHNIDEPRRGWHPDIPIHDVSLGVRGPAVNDMHEAFRLHWNTAKGTEEIAKIPTLPAATPGVGEYASSLQLVRTLNGGAFPAPLDNGEMGVLEAYLRAIENATEFIYFENQYFTNEAIAKALIAAIKAKPALNAILLVNVIPDIPFYAKWQCALIKEIRDKLAADATRIGFFTAWSQEAGKIMPNYVHAKVGIVDNAWATVGSANLDGASLDYFQLFHAFQFGDNRNHELNYLLFNGIDGQPATDAVDVLRRRLWSEHLGYSDPTSGDLTSSGVGDGAKFLTLWRNSSNAKIAALKSSPQSAPSAGLGRVIEYPADPTWSWKDYLTRNAITVDGTALALVEGSRAFSFKTGAWIK